MQNLELHTPDPIRESPVIFNFRGQILCMVTDHDVPKIRRLVNAAYQELADMGLNYTATYQDEQITRERLSKGRAYLIENSTGPIATVLLKKENLFTGKNSAYISQLAVTPTLKRTGLGRLLMDFCELRARDEGFEAVQLDTAKTAKHLVDWYLKRGYSVVGSTRWEGKTYESWIFEKRL